MSKYTCTLEQGEVFHDGMIKSIKCPCDCYEVTDIILNNADGTNIGIFQLIDANGDPTAGVGNVWSAGHYIQARFDLATLCAQVLNGANSKAQKSTRVDTTLEASAWSDKALTFSDAAITATSPIEIIPAVGITEEQFKAFQKAKIIGGTQAAGSVQLVAMGTVPTVSIPVTFIIRRDL